MEQRITRKKYNVTLVQLVKLFDSCCKKKKKKKPH